MMRGAPAKSAACHHGGYIMFGMLTKINWLSICDCVLGVHNGGGSSGPAGGGAKISSSLKMEGPSLQSQATGAASDS
eukprot:CAMPEP_0204186592 /NCGR_PEP_ID=MMETSP0361-20130328/56117_1 /ASSEMBLY_ACC=CAM_ASM_000343 /TAXON_ID=268821 /ORGANISM="Scrippsiella Hangoei, Strain SHTV-5" /LENGTH=76 /DNA_ID=CAMNT_0051146905 /DNA_START=169 /DNA_END=396 /DNA_ORIENTATION=-